MAGPDIRGCSQAAARHQVHPASWIEEPVHFEPHRPRLAVRTAWISDTHLGTAGCNAELLLDFLKSVDCETLYLVGDIIDGWQLRKGWYWPPRHNDIVRCVLKKAKHGTRVVYVPGNHDEAFRGYVGLNLGGVELGASRRSTKRPTGGTLLILHGDEFDGSRALRQVARLPWRQCLHTAAQAQSRAQLGSGASAGCLTGRSRATSRRRSRTRSSSSRASRKSLPMRLTNAAPTVSSAVTSTAPKSGRSANVTYYNDGDWVESCTALVEHADGRMEIIDWAERKRQGGPARKMP